MAFIHRMLLVPSKRPGRASVKKSVAPHRRRPSNGPYGPAYIMQATEQANSSQPSAGWASGFHLLAGEADEMAEHEEAVGGHDEMVQPDFVHRGAEGGHQGSPGTEGDRQQGCRDLPRPHQEGGPSRRRSARPPASKGLLQAGDRGLRMSLGEGREGQSPVLAEKNDPSELVPWVRAHELNPRDGETRGRSGRPSASTASRCGCRGSGRTPACPTDPDCSCVPACK